MSTIHKKVCSIHVTTWLSAKSHHVSGEGRSAWCAEYCPDVELGFGSSLEDNLLQPLGFERHAYDPDDAPREGAEQRGDCPFRCQEKEDQRPIERVAEVAPMVYQPVETARAVLVVRGRMLRGGTRGGSDAATGWSGAAVSVVGRRSTRVASSVCA